VGFAFVEHVHVLVACLSFGRRFVAVRPLTSRRPWCLVTEIGVGWLDVFLLIEGAAPILSAQVVLIEFHLGLGITWAAPYRTESLALESFYFCGVGTSAPFQIEVLANRII
jgi:hypothetical protein